jgi:hypothetical protein
MVARCRAWRRSKKRLVRMVLKANGYEIEGPAPPTVAAAMVDLGDTLLVVSRDSNYKGVDGTCGMNCINFCVVPRTQALRAELEALPSWPADEVCDDSWFDPGWYQNACLRESVPYRTAEEEDDDQEAA